MRGLVLFLAACSSGAPAPADAPQPPPNTPICENVMMTAGCGSGTASVDVYISGLGAGSHSMCSERSQSSHICTGGCTTPIARARSYPFVPNNDWFADDVFSLGNAASALCAETPEAKAGDPCDQFSTDGAGSPQHPCLPTRAQLAGDGSVIGQTYLACGADNVCVSAPAPVVSGYLAPCAAATVSQYGGSGVVGVTFNGCLLAWDEANQRMTSGTTISCIGDWECPEHALCDGSLQVLDASGTIRAVCKPGPRGTLTPAMLTPS